VRSDARKPKPAGLVRQLHLKRTARSALKRRGRIAVRLRIAVTPAGGRPTVTTAAVALRSK
jgi:hypothetical protein